MSRALTYLVGLGLCALFWITGTIAFGILGVYRARRHCPWPGDDEAAQ